MLGQGIVRVRLPHLAGLRPYPRPDGTGALLTPRRDYSLQGRIRCPSEGIGFGVVTPPCSAGPRLTLFPTRTI
jgi:hypothetical protein